METKLGEENSSSGMQPKEGNKTSDGAYTSVREVPSHILSDGQHVYLPPPSALEKASFFARSVAKHDLIHASEDGQSKNKKGDDNKGDGDGDGVGDDQKDGKKDKDDNDLGGIHPLAIASARLQTNGVSELSKAINLASLVQSGEYFAYANIIESSLLHSGAVNVNATSTKPDGSENKTSSTANIASQAATTAPQNMNMNINPPDPMEANLRASFILKRKRQQYQNASFTMKQHHKRLKVITAAQKVTDRRYLELRKRWRLSAPEHGSVVQAPVRANEVVAIDVDVYNHDNEEDDDGDDNRGVIASMVPRYATIELADDFNIDDLNETIRRNDIHVNVNPNVDANGTKTQEGDNIHKSMADAAISLEVSSQNGRELKPSVSSLSQSQHTNEEGEGGTTTNTNASTSTRPSEQPIPMDIDDKGVGNDDANIKSSTNDTTESSNKKVADVSDKLNTVAQPFAMGDPSLGSIDLERFDPDNVDMLTLLFQIEKSSTGFVHSVALSSSIQLDTDKDTDANSDKDIHIDANIDKHGKKKEDESKSKDEVNDIIAAIIQDKVKPKSDERVIQALQHSLFCANVFDSIRREISQCSSQQSGQAVARTNGPGVRNGNQHQNAALKQQQSMHQQQQQEQPSWLSSELEDNFLPPPSYMAGSNGNQCPGVFHSSPLSVIHCHEGEVKVQLDSEYALTVKLVDTKSDKHHDLTNGKIQMKSNKKDVNSDADSGSPDADSGSQTRDQIDLMCRLLQLHAQFVFHDQNKRRSEARSETEIVGEESKVVDYSMGMRRSENAGRTSVNRNSLARKKVTKGSSNILQSCVALGANVLFERQIRDALKVSLNALKVSLKG